MMKEDSYSVNLIIPTIYFLHSNYYFLFHLKHKKTHLLQCNLNLHYNFLIFILKNFKPNLILFNDKIFITFFYWTYSNSN